MLVGALLVLGAFHGALGYFAVGDVVRPTILAAAAAALLTALSTFALRSVHRAACVSALLLLALFLDISNVVFAVAGLGLLAGGLALLRWNLLDARFTMVANIVSAVLLVPPAYKIASFALQRASTEATVPSVFDGLAGDKPSAVLPNIVHIVLDGYSDAAVLRDVYGFDNTSFLNDLQSLGFTVASGARAPYNQTLFSMASVFSGDYLTEAVPAAGLGADAGELRLRLASLVNSGPVHHVLRQSGYTILATESGYGPISSHPDETVLVGDPRWWSGPSLFEEFFSLGRQSLAAAALKALGLQERGSIELILSATGQRAYAGATTPFFLYEHILAPHPPFNVDAGGRYTERWREHFWNISDGDHATHGDPSLQAAYRDGYTAKLQFINARIVTQLRDAIATVPTPKVVIVHGDHGGGAHLVQGDATATCQRERMSPLFAVYTDDPELRAAFAGAAQPGYNIVNTYRIIFDRLYERLIDPLDSHSFFVSWDAPDEVVPLSEARLSASCMDPLN
jgi:hypothetical protein